VASPGRAQGRGIKEDPHRPRLHFYEFFGEYYCHGMMDREAIIISLSIRSMEKYLN
jgi:hypothetical protein